jgi:hypothetical protein
LGRRRVRKDAPSRFHAGRCSVAMTVEIVMW